MVSHGMVTHGINAPCEFCEKVKREFSYNKYHVAPKEERTLDGHIFASKAEMKRYAELKLLVKGKVIKNLELQPKLYYLKKITDETFKYIGDFKYEEKGKTIIEDVKGFETPIWRLKWKICKIVFPEYEFRIIK